MNKVEPQQKGNRWFGPLLTVVSLIGIAVFGWIAGQVSLKMKANAEEFQAAGQREPTTAGNEQTEQQLPESSESYTIEEPVEEVNPPAQQEVLAFPSTVPLSKDETWNRVKLAELDVAAEQSVAHAVAFQETLNIELVLTVAEVSVTEKEYTALLRHNIAREFDLGGNRAEYVYNNPLTAYLAPGATFDEWIDPIHQTYVNTFQGLESPIARAALSKNRSGVLASLFSGGWGEKTIAELKRYQQSGAAATNDLKFVFNRRLVKNGVLGEDNESLRPAPRLSVSPARLFNEVFEGGSNTTGIGDVAAKTDPAPTSDPPASSGRTASLRVFWRPGSKYTSNITYQFSGRSQKLAVSDRGVYQIPWPVGATQLKLFVMEKPGGPTKQRVVSIPANGEISYIINP